MKSRKIITEIQENLLIELYPATFGKRFLAAAYDYVILSVITAIIIAGVVIVLFPPRILRFLQSFPPGVVETLLTVTILIIFFIQFGLYFILYEGLGAGQTPGKRRLKLRVVNVDGTPIGLREAIIRNLFRIVDFLPAYFFLGILLILLTSKGQRIGDIVAGTLVISEELKSLELRPDAPPSLTGLPISVSREQFELIRLYIERRSQLFPEARAKVRSEILEKLDYDGPPLQEEETELLLEDLYRRNRPA